MNELVKLPIDLNGLKLQRKLWEMPEFAIANTTRAWNILIDECIGNVGEDEKLFADFTVEN